MEHYKTSKLLNSSIASKFVTKKWVEITYSSSSQYSFAKNMRFRTSMLRTDLRDYDDVCIVVTGRISVKGC